MAGRELYMLDSSYFKRTGTKSNNCIQVTEDNMKRAIVCLLLCATSLIAQTGAKNGEWRTYGGDLGNTHYSPLDQISAANFNNLQIAWRFKTDNLGPSPEFNLES